jgi:hypothetical protein
VKHGADAEQAANFGTCCPRSLGKEALRPLDPSSDLLASLEQKNSWNTLGEKLGKGRSPDNNRWYPTDCFEDSTADQRGVRCMRQHKYVNGIQSGVELFSPEKLKASFDASIETALVNDGPESARIFGGCPPSNQEGVGGRPVLKDLVYALIGPDRP